MMLNYVYDQVMVVAVVQPDGSHKIKLRLRNVQQDPRISFQEKKVSAQDGSQEIKLYLGAFQHLLVIKSLIKLCERKQIQFDKRPDANLMSSIPILFRILEEHGFAFIAIAQLVSDYKSGALKLVEIAPKELSEEEIELF